MPDLTPDALRALATRCRMWADEAISSSRGEALAKAADTLDALANDPRLATLTGDVPQFPDWASVRADVYARDVARAAALRADRDALVPLARLGAWAIAELREHGADLDGGDVQDRAESFGAIAPQQVATACSEGCACAEYFEDGEEMTCYRDTPATQRARAFLQRLASEVCGG